jgi:uncharacterized protein
MKKIFFIILIISMFIMPNCLAKEYHMKLLAVSEKTDVPKGMVADLYLEITPGTGRIFIDTFPLTKIDTQISTRHANRMACNFLEIDCSNQNFIYTIRSNSVIIGGPSAGGALTVLTMAALTNENFDEEIAMTGTINSGGLIGTVGGLKEKISAASENGIKKVLIPKGERFNFKIINKNGTNETYNETIDLYEYGKEKGIEVKEVAIIEEAYFEFTGIDYRKDYGEIQVSKDYANIMKEVSNDLCTRTDDLKKKVNIINSSLYIQADNFSKKAEISDELEKYYSKASYCFGANLKLSNQILIEEDPNMDELQEKIHEIQNKILAYDNELDKYQINTIPMLQTYEIVKERLIEAEDYIKDCALDIEKNNTKNALYHLSYGIERYNSAIAWSNFFELTGKELNLDKETLRESCVQKIAEAEERFQYVQFYLPYELKNTRDQITKAYTDLNNEDYELCLFKALKAKAESNVILGALNYNDDNYDSYLETKMNIVRNQISKQQQKEQFPILGYSYYEYANSLKMGDKYSALLYLEYALELSNLDIYFNNNKKMTNFKIDNGFYKLIMIFIIGAIFGFFSRSLFLKKTSKKNGIHIRIRKRH